MLRSFLQRINRKEFYFIYIILFIVLIFTVFRINGSSIGTYNSFLNGDQKDSNLLFGSPRSIRSDEWMVSTPLTVSQSNFDFPQINPSIGIGQELSVLYDAPTKHWSSIFDPYNWSFFVMPLENAFAFKWWIRGALVLISIYLFLMFITKKNYWLSIGGAIIIYFSPFLQWWYSTAALECVAYIFFALYFALKLFHYKNKKELVIYSVLLTFFSLCFAFILYPPFQISVALGAGFFLLGYILDHRKELNKNRILSLVATITGVGITIGVALYGYIHDFKNVIDAIRNTSYPGQRIVEGGNYPWAQFLIGPYNFIYQGKGIEVPAFLGNKSEGSSFLMFFVFLIPATIYASVYKFIKTKKIKFTYIFQVLFLLLGTTWVIVGLPTIIGKITLLNLVPQNRMIIGLGIFGIIFAIYFLSDFSIKDIKFFKPLSILLTLSTLIIFFFISNYLRTNYHNFISTKYLILASISMTILVGLLLLKRQKLFILAACTYCIFSTILINPLYVGMKPLVNQTLKTELGDLNEAKSSRWVIFEKDMNLNDFLPANGFNTLNGVHLYPQFDMWEKIDPEKKFSFEYNRYAHVTFQETDSQELTIENPYPDVTVVKINPCDNKLDQLNVKYYVFFDKTDKYGCLNYIKTIEFPKVKFNVYQKI